MPLSEDQYQQLIVAELGDTADGLLAANIATYWTKNDTIADLELRYRATERDAIVLLLGAARQGADFRTSSGSAVSLDQVFQHLLDMQELVNAALMEAQAGAGGGGAIGQIATTAPIMPDTPRSFDANARRYRGDPLRRPR